MKEIEILMRDVNENRLSLEDAGRKLVELIYKNKQWFGLNKLGEDELHDFMLENYTLFIRLFKNYDNSKGDFLCYLLGNVSQAFQGWKRESARVLIKRKTLEEIEYTRLRSEGIYEFTGEALYVSDILLDQEHPSEEIKRMISYHNMHSQRTEGTRKAKALDRFRQDVVLILMVKSWYLIDSVLLEKISAVTQIQEDTLTEILDRTKKLMEKKTNQFNFTIKNRDRSYYFKELYRVESDSYYGKRLAYLINRKQSYHSENWNRFNMKLQSQNRKLVPSNRIVSLVLGMDQRRIQYLLEKANKNMDNLSLNCYYGRHEDLLGERKFE